MKSPESSPTNEQLPERNKDGALADNDVDLARWPLLAPLLLDWRTEASQHDAQRGWGFEYYDRWAVFCQRVHGWLVVFAAVAATAALLFCIFYLAIPYHGFKFWLSMLELAVTMLALAVVVTGITSIMDDRWRRLRFQAELYRSLKFRYLLDADQWLSRPQEERRLALFKHLSQIHSANSKTIKNWIKRKVELIPPITTPDREPDSALADEQASYFRENRLENQHNYFSRQSKSMHGIEGWVRRIGPWCFFLSIGFVVCHSICEWIPIASLAFRVAKKGTTAAMEGRAEKEHPLSVPGEKSKDLHQEKEVSTDESHADQHQEPALSTFDWWVLGFAVLSVALPIFAAGVRTWRGAWEFGRNSLRFEALAHQLHSLLEELSATKSAAAKLELLRRAESELEYEHRAWMRLMVEAEWFG